ncbi:carbohydrate binding domain-containing protein [Geminisphaera colitermitum]|uniref:carbohydrate binding domain-containing protein n=1 Tax=Geminisphaera colitermitum TaxID=1148786 RepID=UPI000158CE03|nr:carbohydrate binding domain-containing protein [Geminisphaera colitermitum]
MQLSKILKTGLALAGLTIGSCFFPTFAAGQTIKNAGFEEGAPETGFVQKVPRGWTWKNSSFYWIASGLAPVFANATAQEGKAFVGLQRSASDDVAAVLKQRVTGLSEGKTYTLSVWIRARNAGSRSAKWTISVMAAGETIAAKSGQAQTEAWEEQSVTFTATGPTVIIRLSVNNEPGKDQIVFFDNVTLTTTTQ